MNEIQLESTHYPAFADRELGDTTTDLIDVSKDPVTKLSHSGLCVITTFLLHQEHFLPRESLGQ